LFGQYIARLPLTKTATIVHGNALRIDWESVVPKTELSFILGNPPFNGARTMTDAQKSDMLHVFGNTKGTGNLDYVTAWYKKAADMMGDAAARAAFVSTNSITQGEQPGILWKPLMDNGIFINFGIPTFKWSNEAKGKAAVHCVIIGFSYARTTPNINPYLLDAPNVFIDKRQKPLCDVPEITRGSDPVDGGNLIIEEDEYEDFIKREPSAAKYVRQYMMGNEFLNNKKRYCLWLVDAAPDDLLKLPLLKERIEKCRQMRLASSRANTLKAADTPFLFESNRQPDTDYIVLPKVSSEHRRYIPIGYLSKDVIVGDTTFTVSNANLYHFGVLTSSIHNAWIRYVCGRLEMRYRYSNTLVYNNFPWPDSTDAQKAEIERFAQAVLNARALHPESSLAALYNQLSMPPELLKAHKELDRAVMKLYNFSKDMTEAEIVAALMERYLGLVGGG
ncbi:MAG: methylase, partial [Treponema sp.]|nr:methylase [Treponema sp.]